MRLARSAVFFALIIDVLSIDSQNCGTAYRPCNYIDNKYGNGFTCYENDGVANETCVPATNWCSLQSGYKYLKNCPQQENLMLENCLNFDVKIDGIEYHVNMLKSDWTIAEQYCQSKRMHLASFSSQKQYENVVKFLQKMKQNPAFISQDSNVENELDNLAQKCAEEMRDPSGKLFWTGIYFDKNSQSWKNSDGTPLNDEIKSKTSTIQQTIDRVKTLPDDNYRFIRFFDKNYDFELSSDAEHSKKTSSLTSRGHILCKKPAKFATWTGQPKPDNIGCVSGYKCTSQSKCISGLSLTDSDICNGRNDCKNGDDESEANCHFFQVHFPNQFRVAHFLPIRRSAAEAKQLCASKGMHLPSIHSQSDIDFLLSLPQLYAQSQINSRNFHLVQQDWKSIENRVLVGIRKFNNGTWFDGSQVSYLRVNILRLTVETDVYLVPGEKILKSEFEFRGTVFPICQNGKFASGQKGTFQGLGAGNSASSVNFNVNFLVMLFVTLLLC